MAYIKCACGQEHDMPVASMVNLINALMAGDMHLVSRDYPGRWEGIKEQTGNSKAVQIRARCAREAIGVNIKATRSGPGKHSRPEPVNDTEIRQGG